MYISSETFISETGRIFNDGQEISETEYEELSPEDQKSFRWYADDADDE